MNKDRFKEYYIGLDIGTNSVGWAVTYPNYSIPKFNKKSMWGVRKFEAADTAESRRMYRSARRRLKRRKARLDFLRAQFEEEINKIDPKFFERLDNSDLHHEDKTLDTKNSLFDDKNFKDVDYHEKYPTIYHLRKELMYSDEYHDPRLVYLALHHILKYRGHFLFEGNLKSENNFEKLLTEFNDWTFNIFDSYMFNLNQELVNSIENQLKNRDITNSDKQKWLKKQINTEVSAEVKKSFEQLTRAISGMKITDLGAIFFEKELEDKYQLELNSENIEEQIDELSFLTEDEKNLVLKAKAILDWSMLEEILRGKENISDAKVQSYEEHGKDLKLLKSVLKSDVKAFKEMFADENSDKNYVAYIGKSIKTANKSTIDYETFKKFVATKIKQIDDPKVKIIEEKLDNGTFMPKQRVGTNGVIPHQLHLNELVLILSNASKYLEFLRDVDDTSLSVKEKIIEIFKFRIPYYVGPINDYHKDKGGNAWIEWKNAEKKEKLYPWNFENQVDIDKTATKFIERMTNNCTYLLNEKVLPKHSLLYQKFMVLNEINNIKIDGNPIDIGKKQELFKDLFEDSKSTVTKNKIVKWLQNKNYENKGSKPLITGVDDIIKSKLSTLHDMKDIFENDLPEMSVLDNIVKYNTLFSDAKDIFINKIKEEYGELLSEEQINKLATKNYAGWGRLSREFLEEISDDKHFENGTPTSIIQALYSTNLNLMELLSNSYDFSYKINEINKQFLPSVENMSYEMLDELYVSPSVKRAIWQSLKIVDEIVSITKHRPTKIFIEMSRGADGSGRTTSRKDNLIKLYEAINNNQDYKELIEELSQKIESLDEKRFKSKKLYLYFTQLGKCMYSGLDIDFNDLIFNDNLYDIDHIYPRSKTKDDSFSNLVLVKKDLNQRKGNEYPLKKTLNIDWETKTLWKLLRKVGLINEKKYNRLMRDKELDSRELSGFIERQLVETRQSTKAVSSILKKVYPTSEIVFAKARNAYELRQHLVNETEDRSLYKVRMINDYHHAKDAYLNIVSGNVHHVKFTSNPFNYLNKSADRDYNLAKMYNRDIIRNGKVAWTAGENGTIKKVIKTMKQNDVLTTWLQYDRNGTLFDLMLMKKGKGQVRIKKNKMIEKYGGYNKPQVAHYSIVDHVVKGKKQRWLVTVPVHISNRIDSNQDLINYFQQEHEPILNDVKIIVDHLHAANQLIEIGNIKGRITGKTNARFVIRNEIEVVLSEKNTILFKEIEKFNLFNNFDKDILNEETLEFLYEDLVSKAQESIYSFRDEWNKKLENKKELFNKLNFKDKIYVVTEILTLFKSTRSLADLKLIGEGGQAGMLTIGRNLTKRDNVYLINQSITGLFENKVDVMKL